MHSLFEAIQRFQKVILMPVNDKKVPGLRFVLMVQKLFRTITEKIPAVDRVDGRKMHL